MLQELDKPYAHRQQAPQLAVRAAYEAAGAALEPAGEELIEPSIDPALLEEPISGVLENPWEV
jgi:hypothetical protein